MEIRTFTAALLLVASVSQAGEPNPRSATARAEASATIVPLVTIALPSPARPAASSAPRAGVSRESTPEGEVVTLNFE